MSRRAKGWPWWAWPIAIVVGLYVIGSGLVLWMSYKPEGSFMSLAPNEGTWAYRLFFPAVWLAARLSP